jgi:hypothetical protein
MIHSQALQHAALGAVAIIYRFAHSRLTKAQICEYCSWPAALFNKTRNIAPNITVSALFFSES